MYPANIGQYINPADCSVHLYVEITEIPSIIEVLLVALSAVKVNSESKILS